MRPDEFVCADIETLLQWVLRDLEERREIFGIPEELFFTPKATDPFRMRRFGKLLETPLGVAAGPHTQLAQNIISAYLCGARYIELKTIQVLDELEVTKPCIDMTDEGYNCEWSQELRLDQSFDQYLNAFILLYILRDKFQWESAEPGFIFNMSAGYNLEGIRSPKVQRFLDRMADCTAELEEKIARVAPIYPRVRQLEIPTRLSDNLTVSTMHGCPPDEVEKIGRYFIEERGLHTTIKFNPTLLGPDRLREILNDRLGYATRVPDAAFEHDLKYEDALDLIASLLKSAEARGVRFSLKLTNTLETENIEQNLPDGEPTVYMSGRALHPISINLAARLQEAFDGHLDISFAGGVDCFNIVDTLACGLRPVTMSSDILKPGGYGRLSQYLEILGNEMSAREIPSLEALPLSRTDTDDPREAALRVLKAYAKRVVESGRYAKQRFPYRGVKTSRPLPLFDCAAAPCVDACAADQDIPRYLDFTARGEDEKAFRTILATNPFPAVQGMVCTHLCQFQCTRVNYDAPVLIREIKRFVAQRRDERDLPAALPANGRRVGVIGAGPTGLSCAYFLALAGFEVDIYESKAFPGGMVADAIPAFRLDKASLEKDIHAILSLGVRLHTESAVGRETFEELRRTKDFVIIAVGAQESLTLGIPGEEADGVLDQLSFLSAVRRGEKPALGRRVVVVGGGNAAIDVARAAKRFLRESGEVTIVYRRTRREMPCDPDELREALEEGISLRELTQPIRVLTREGRVTALQCDRMRLGEKDASGRRRPERVEGAEFTLEVDTVITAIGQRIRLDFLPDGALEVNPETLETQAEGVYAGGDAVRGASSIVEAIGDGRRVAEAIMRKSGLSFPEALTPEDDRSPDLRELFIRRARRAFGPEPITREPGERLDFTPYVGTLPEEDARREAARCLQCDLLCNICVTVCPNRANVALSVSPVRFPLQRAVRDGNGVSAETVGWEAITQPYQVVNIADFCNACGNCETFCPSSGAPYRDKAKVHLSRESLEASGRGVYFPEPGVMEGLYDGKRATLRESGDVLVYEDADARAELDAETLIARSVTLKEGVSSKDLAWTARMAVLYRWLNGRLPVANRSV